jgi:hypothetical protein
LECIVNLTVRVDVRELTDWLACSMLVCWRMREINLGFVHCMDVSYVCNECESCSVVLIRSCRRPHESGAAIANGCTACWGNTSCFTKFSKDERRV